MAADPAVLVQRANERADHYLYRCFDPDGVLLYIGCTRDVKKRMANHACTTTRHNASWWLSVCMARYEVDGPYRGLTRGRKAERKAIAAEQPVFNTQDRGTSVWTARTGIARYLVAHGHRGIATETACTCRDGLFARDEYCAAHEGQAVA